MNYMIITVNKKFLFVVLGLLLAVGGMRVAYSVGYETGLKDMAEYYREQIEKYDNKA